MNPAHHHDLHRAIMLNEQGQHYPAIELLRRILTDDPEDPEAHSILAIALLGTKRIHAALKEAELGLLLAPADKLAHHAMACTLIAHQRVREAKMHAEQCLVFDPQDVDALRTLALIASLEHRRDTQKTLLRKARELAPDNPAVLVACGRFAFSQGDLEHAWQEAHTALTERPEHQDALVLMGEILLRRGDQHGAREHAIWALQQDPTDSCALALLCSIKARQSWSLGMWWRWQAWISAGGALRATLQLVAVFIGYRLLVLIFVDAGHKEISQFLNIAWLAFVLYTWAAPGRFAKMLANEMQQAQLRETY